MIGCQNIITSVTFSKAVLSTVRYAIVKLVTRREVFIDEFLDKFICSYVKGMFRAWTRITSLSSFFSLANDDSLSVFVTRPFAEVFLNGSP